MSTTRKPKLPKGWEAYPSRTFPGQVYFCHNVTRESIWQSAISNIYDLGGDEDDSVGLITDDPQLNVEFLEPSTSSKAFDKDALQKPPSPPFFPSNCSPEKLPNSEYFLKTCPVDEVVNKDKLNAKRPVANPNKPEASSNYFMNDKEQFEAGIKRRVKCVDQLEGQLSYVKARDSVLDEKNDKWDQNRLVVSDLKSEEENSTQNSEPSHESFYSISSSSCSQSDSQKNRRNSKDSISPYLSETNKFLNDSLISPIHQPSFAKSSPVTYSSGLFNGPALIESGISVSPSCNFLPAVSPMSMNEYPYQKSPAFSCGSDILSSPMYDPQSKNISVASSPRDHGSGRKRRLTDTPDSTDLSQAKFKNKMCCTESSWSESNGSFNACNFSNRHNEIDGRFLKEFLSSGNNSFNDGEKSGVFPRSADRGSLDSSLLFHRRDNPKTPGVGELNQKSYSWSDSESTSRNDTHHESEFDRPRSQYNTARIRNVRASDECNHSQDLPTFNSHSMDHRSKNYQHREPKSYDKLRFRSNYSFKNKGRDSYPNYTKYPKRKHKDRILNSEQFHQTRFLCRSNISPPKRLQSSRQCFPSNENLAQKPHYEPLQSKSPSSIFNGSSVQNRLKKAQMEILNRAKSVNCTQTSDSSSQVAPVVQNSPPPSPKQCSQERNYLIPSPKELVAKFSLERPDVVKLSKRNVIEPKLSATSSQPKRNVSSSSPEQNKPRTPSKKILSWPDCVKSESEVSTSDFKVKRVQFQEGHEERVFDASCSILSSKSPVRKKSPPLIDFLPPGEDSSGKDEDRSFKSIEKNAVVKSEENVSSKQLTPAQYRLEKFRDAQISKTKTVLFESPIIKSNVPSAFEPINQIPAALSPNGLDSVCDTTNASPNLNQEEPMEWEEIPTEQIISKVNETRLYLSMCSNKQKATWVPPLQSPPRSEHFFIVLDTNILLSGISFVVTLRDSKFKDHGYPVIAIPWQVIQEIDSIKNSQRTSIQPKAVEAKNFLFENFFNKHPRMRGQTMEEWKKTADVCVSPDDIILSYVLDLKAQGKHVIFVTDDMNLVTKAIINKVDCYTKEKILEKLKSEREKVNFEAESPKPCVQSSDSGHSTASTEDKIADLISARYNELMCLLQNTLKDYLSLVIQIGIIRTYGELCWPKYVYIPPPWESVIDCLKLLDKHKFSILKKVPGSAFSRNITELVTHFKNHVKGVPVDKSTLKSMIKKVYFLTNILKYDYDAETNMIHQFLQKFRHHHLPAVEDEIAQLKNSSSMQQNHIDSDAKMIAFPVRNKFSPAHSSPSVPVSLQTQVANNFHDERMDAPAEINDHEIDNSFLLSNSAVIALNHCYKHCKDLCFSMCELLKIPHDLTGAQLVDKSMGELKEELPELIVFVKQICNSFQRLFDLQKAGRLKNSDDYEVKKLFKILREFLNELPNGSDLVPIIEHLFLFFSDLKFKSTRNTGFSQLKDLQSYFMQSRTEFDKLNIF